jgi:SAM-dependent methyltransferase
MSDTGAHGTGPGEIAADGSAVELYAATPPDRHSVDLVHRALPAGASVLELGAGTGRITHGLLELGHTVVAVDDSAAMLARIQGARTVCSRIEELHLDERFDIVLMMSYLVNYGDRGALLDSCRRHVSTGGAVIVQREGLRWHDEAEVRVWERDGVHYRMYDIDRPEPGFLTATIEYRMGDRTWTHTFTSRSLTDEELPEVLAAADLRLDRFLDDDPAWVLARPA